MASDVVIPEVGELGMDVAFVRWLKAEGDEVAVGDELFEVDTEKSIMTVEAYAAGTLADVRVGEGDVVAPRDVIARILEPGETAETDQGATPSPDAAIDTPPAAAGAVRSSSAAPAAAPPTQRGERRAGVSPRARRVAKELGIDTSDLVGSGPDGLITEADVRAAATATDPSAASEPQAGRERARRAVADLTTSSWQSIPHFHLELEADVEAGLALARPTPLVFASVAQALVRHPECNLAWDGDHPVQRDSVDLGLLVDAPVGLMLAVIRNAQDLDVADMADAIRAAAERARTGKLSTDDLGPRSLTVSNLGMYSVDRLDVVITKPDVLTLGVGRTRPVPHWDGSAFVPRRVLGMTLAVDHRALDGATAARFMTTLEQVLADPVAEGLA